MDRQWAQILAFRAERATRPAPEHGRPITDQRARTGADFVLGEEIGRGSYSTVLQATERESGRACAVKVINKKFITREKKTHEVMREKEALIQLRNPAHVVALLFTYQDSDSLCFALELCNNGDLQQLVAALGPLALGDATFLARQLAEAIGFCHEQGFVHRDVKPDNCLLDHQLHVKLTDFAGSKSIVAHGRGRKSSFVGTPEFVPPEILNAKPSTYASDWWSFACSFYFLLTGEHVFDQPSQYMMFEAICQAEYKLPAWLPREAAELIRSLLQVDPAVRIPGTEADSEADRHGLAYVLGLPLFANQPVEPNTRLQLCPTLPASAEPIPDAWVNHAAKPTGTRSPRSVDECPYRSLLPAEAQLEFWDHVWLVTPGDKRVLAWLVCRDHLYSVDVGDTLQGKSPSLYHMLPLSEVVGVVAVQPDAAAQEGAHTPVPHVIVQARHRTLILRRFEMDDVDFAAHPEHLIYETHCSCPDLAVAILTHQQQS